MVPGATALQRTPVPTSSAATASARASTAPLVALYSARWGSPAYDATDAVTTTAAWSEARRCGIAAASVRAIPVTLTSSTRAHSAS